ncbi:Amidase [Penicillium verhagenii]|nr:Amidase [Penicillium verhagenii]
MALETWQSLVQKKQADVAARIPAAWRLSAEYINISETANTNVLDVPRRCGILSPQQIEITENYDATDLLEMIHNQKLSAYEVTEAFCIRAAIAQQVTNCLTETLFDGALKHAKGLDEHLKSTGKPGGPLHGLPISFKDCFNIEGVPSTIGFTSFIENGPMKYNSSVVQILKKLGAIPYVKTNIPQTMMAADSHNYIFGRTLNPHRSNLTAGGSSGGEGALIAMRGSVLGIGTDIAGSIRIPAICNGTFALKPSADRIPIGGQTGSGRDGVAGIKACAGPLATSVRDLELLMRVVTNEDPWQVDSTAIFSPWRIVTPKSTLRLGLIQEDPNFPLHPPILRTLTQATERIRQAGHEIIPLSTPSIRDACALAFQAGEPTIPALSSTDLPHEYMPYEYAPLTLDGLYDLIQQRNNLKDQFRALITQTNIDAIIMPGYQGTAQIHDLYGFPLYTVLMNVLDYPACIIPFGKAEQTADLAFTRDVQYKPPFSHETFEGAPCCIQITGRHMRDEELVQVAQTVANILEN